MTVLETQLQPNQIYLKGLYIVDSNSCGLVLDTLDLQVVPLGAHGTALTTRVKFCVAFMATTTMVVIIAIQIVPIRRGAM